MQILMLILLKILMQMEIHLDDADADADDYNACADIWLRMQVVQKGPNRCQLVQNAFGNFSDNLK